jgi:hypothetical protein
MGFYISPSHIVRYGRTSWAQWWVNVVWSPIATEAYFYYFPVYHLISSKTHISSELSR